MRLADVSLSPHQAEVLIGRVKTKYLISSLKCSFCHFTPAGKEAAYFPSSPFSLCFCQLNKNSLIE